MRTDPPAPSARCPLSFALAILSGAFLLFLVQPILGRYLAPRFGGGAGVWTTCLVFFQVWLLAGYAYAHGLRCFLSPRRQIAVHMALLGASLWFLPIGPDPVAEASLAAPVVGVLGLLLLEIGLPYLLLAATGPLLQAWFSVAVPGRSPYRLFAVSNLGSLVGLLGYPFLIEPWLSLRVQGWTWTSLYLVHTFACILAARRVGSRNAPARVAAATPRGVPPGRPALWIALAATGSLMLVATTNRLCQDLAAMPLLWVVPLAIYLGTFIVCFDHDRWYDRRVFVTLLVVAVAATTWTSVAGNESTWFQVATRLVMLVASCMVCHGELARRRPAPERLTSYYLAIALGGAIGGTFVGVVAPALFADYWEYPIGVIVTCVLALACVGSALRDRVSAQPWRVGVACGYGGLLVVIVGLTTSAYREHRKYVASYRNFYGVLHVQKKTDPYGRRSIVLVHGNTQHGKQFADPDKRRWATTYYGRESGVGLALAAIRGTRKRNGLTVGVIGLGAGTMAALAEAGDHVRFYEIDPDVELVARRYFTFLADSAARIEVAIGDGRLLLERELRTRGSRGFDVLAIDAFSSHAIPMHLLTKEAFQTYDEHLDPSGVVAFHVSHRFLDLVPVARGVAQDAGYEVDVVVTPEDQVRARTQSSTWVLASKDAGVLHAPRIRLLAERRAAGGAAGRLWTDDFASLLPVLGADHSRGRWLTVPNRGRFVVDGANLLEPAFEERLIWDLRKLYDDSARPLMLVTFGAVPPEYATHGDDAAAAFRRVLFRDLGLAADPHALMLVVGAADRSLSVECGRAFGEANRQRARQMVAETMIPALARQEPAAAVDAGLRVLRGLQLEVGARPR